MRGNFCINTNMGMELKFMEREKTILNSEKEKKPEGFLPDYGSLKFRNKQKGF